MSAISFKLPAAANKALENSLFIFARDVLDATIAYVRTNDIDLRRADLDATALAAAIGCAAVVKTVETKPKTGGGRKPKSKTVTDNANAPYPKYDWFPFCNVVYPTRCMGIQVRGGLMNQCLTEPKTGCEFCAKCETKRVGDIRTRVCVGEPEKTKEFVLTTVSKSGKTTRKTPTSVAKYLADLEKRYVGKEDAEQYKASTTMEAVRTEADRLSRVMSCEVAISEWDTKIEKKSRGRKASGGSSGESNGTKSEIDVDDIDYQKVLKDLDDIKLVDAKKMLKAVAAKAGVDDAEIKKLTKKDDVKGKLKEICENQLLAAQLDDVSEEEAQETNEAEVEQTEAEEDDEEASVGSRVRVDLRDAKAESSDEEEEEEDDELVVDEEEEEEEDEEDEEARLRERRAANLCAYDIQDYKKTDKEIAIKGDVVYAYDNITETVGDAIGKVKNGKVGILAKFKEDYETKKDKKIKTRSARA